MIPDLRKNGAAAALLVCCMVGCSGMEPPPTVPMVADVLMPPAKYGAFLKLRAKGVQVYECKVAEDSATRYEWVFREPLAELFDKSDTKIGVHYAGPAWEHNDGSIVTGKTSGRIESVERTSIPWLLLVATQASKTGTFAKVKFIQRLETVGGAAPRTGCSANAAGKEAKIGYTANYYFYEAR